LIRRMAAANLLWGAPRIHGELQKLGISVSQATVAKYLPRRDKPPSQPWRTFPGRPWRPDSCRFLRRANGHPPAVVRGHHPRARPATDRQIAVTDHPTAAWTAQQLRNAFPEDQAPQYLLHDRDHAFTNGVSTMAAMPIHEVVTAPRSPWQNAYIERLIGSILLKLKCEFLTSPAAARR
jgi:putative transposase